MKTTKPFKTIEFTLPSHFASALINWDLSGLSDEDVSLINAFTIDQAEKHGSFYCINADVDNTGFTSHNDLPGMRNMGADTCTFTFAIDK